jgi:hypothetical protein
MQEAFASVVGLITLSAATLLAQSAAQSFSDTVSDSM